MSVLMPPYIRDGLADPPASGAVPQPGSGPNPPAIFAWDCDDPIPIHLDEVTFWVPPYVAGHRELSMMERMPGLQVVQTLTAGVDNVLAHLPDGVTLCNATGVHDASTAELAVGLTIASLRHLDEFARAMPTGEWRYDRHEALADKRVLIVGFGAIGRAIARRLDGFECEIVPVARSAREVDGLRVRAVAELPTLLPTAEVVILILPLNDETRGMVDSQFLARMRDGALLVNVSRGPVVDTEALRAECATGRLRAALDVTDPEPLPPDHPLWRTPGVLLSPHVGGNTSAFLPRARRLVADQLRRWFAGEPLHNVVVGGG